MDLHVRAVDRDAQRPLWLSLLGLRLQLNALQLSEDALQHALVDPTPSAHVDRVPGTEAYGQGAPGTSFFGDEQSALKRLSRRQLAVPAWSRHEWLDPRPLCVGQLHDHIDPAARPSRNSATGLKQSEPALVEATLALLLTSQPMVTYGGQQLYFSSSSAARAFRSSNPPRRP